MLKEFREFAMRGNVVDLAVGVIIGAAFGKIVEALVDDIIMPIIGIAGKADFSNYFVGLSSAVTATNLADARKQGGVLAYGDFITDSDQFPDRRRRAVRRHQGHQYAEQKTCARARRAAAADRRGRAADRDPRRSEGALRPMELTRRRLTLAALFVAAMHARCPRRSRTGAKRLRALAPISRRRAAGGWASRCSIPRTAKSSVAGSTSDFPSARPARR